MTSLARLRADPHYATLVFSSTLANPVKEPPLMATASSSFPNLLTLLENDALVDFSPALITFLTSVQAAKADPLKLQLAWMALMANLAQEAPTAEGDLIGQLSEVILVKIETLVVQAKAALPPV